jgi:hypothetical protein
MIQVSQGLCGGPNPNVLYSPRLSYNTVSGNGLHVFADQSLPY